MPRQPERMVGGPASRPHDPGGWPVPGLLMMRTWMHMGRRASADPLWRNAFLVIAIAIISIFLAQEIVDRPLKFVAAFGALLALGAAFALPSLVNRLFVVLLGLLLTGYAFFGRVFSHLGVPPLFVGEVVLLVGVVAFLTNRQRWTAFRSPIAWLYLAFAMWGAVVCAAPYLRVYGLDTLRDSVTWGYGVFAILVPATLLRRGWLLTVLRRYAQVIPLLLLWLPVGLLASQAFRQLLPIAQESGEQMVFVKPGDAGIHLGGAAAFLLLGLHHAPGIRRYRGPLGMNWFLGAACLGAFVAVAMLGRGGALATLSAIAAVLVLRPVLATPKVMLIGAGAIALSLVLLASNIAVELGRRDFSVQQITTNLLSIVGDVSDEQRNLEQTEDWRLRWWTKVVNYTVYGPYFWTGKGFGVNLTTEDGIKRDAFNRNPHSAHLSILARTGVPGLLLWLLLQGAFGAMMIATYLQAQRRGREWWARLNLWLFAYWLAFIVDMSFAVLLEGPQGGIWFWSLLGLGIAVMQVQREQETVPEPLTPVSRTHEALAGP
jgi:hypothetical protein